MAFNGCIGKICSNNPKIVGLLGYLQFFTCTILDNVLYINVYVFLIISLQ